MQEDGSQSRGGASHRRSRPAASSGPARLSSEALFGHASEVVIEHYGEEYRLRRTRNGRLILTK